ncbi:TIGR02452 family protein [Candidatus Bipolaricaulota bacterium]|nr:TIGR02452 family protein [Candidatus Bipolaricaulota bacterium]
MEAIDRGYYISESDERVTIEDQVEEAVQGTKLYRPEDLGKLSGEVERQQAEDSEETEFEVRNETTLRGAQDLVERDDAGPFVLNFASARNPGGGFLNGSGAQEESLARSSALYPCLKSEMGYYRENERSGTSLYTDHMIYSPDVPVIRDDDGLFLEEPYLVSLLTAPAVNRNALKRNEPEKLPRVREVMERRTHKVLTVAAVEGHRDLVLGAWGCGVFGNAPEAIAELFAGELNGTLSNYFRSVRFSVLDRSKSKSTYRAFREV